MSLFKQRFIQYFWFLMLIIVSPYLSFAGTGSFFKAEPPLLKNPSPHTFVFFIQGAADHYVPETLDQPFGKYVRADASDVKAIKHLSLQCPSCNVVLLHIQVGGARWYTANHPWATYLRVYSQNKKIFTRHVDVLNAADPSVVSRLLQFSEKWFPKSKIHFFYRGHSFLSEYNPMDPEKRPPLIKPFDTNFPETSYGTRQFIQSLESAQLHKPLASLTFAACSMTDPNLEKELSSYTQKVISTTRSIIECPKSHGFSYDFLQSIKKEDSEESAAKKIEEEIFRKG